MALPKWLLPTGLAALVLGGLAWIRKPSLKAGDTVGVHAGRLLDPSGRLAAFLLTLPPSAKIALQLNHVEGSALRGDVVGFVDPSTVTVVRLNIPVGVGPFGFTTDDVSDIFRDNKKI